MKILTDEENKVIGYASDGDGDEYDGECPVDFSYNFNQYKLIEGILMQDILKGE